MKRIIFMLTLLLATLRSDGKQPASIFQVLFNTIMDGYRGQSAYIIDSLSDADKDDSLVTKYLNDKYPEEKLAIEKVNSNWWRPFSSVTIDKKKGYSLFDPIVNESQDAYNKRTKPISLLYFSRLNYIADKKMVIFRMHVHKGNTNSWNGMRVYENTAGIWHLVKTFDFSIG